MKNRKVFIGWSGEDNHEMAHEISNRLSQYNFHAVVGGEWQSSFAVSETIINQMNGCEFGIFLIEKETRINEKTKETVSIGFNPNVMMELGYMLRKVSDYSRVRRILINIRADELPSDLQGTWTDEIKVEFDKNDPEARAIAISKAADTVTEKFLSYFRNIKGTDKLDYFDNWDENKLDIYNYTGDEPISDKLIYGMQAAIYSGDFDRLYERLKQIKETLSKKDPLNDLGAVSCALAVLQVFVVTRRLTVGLNDLQFSKLCDDLEVEYEKTLKDVDLKAWCSIFRMDKLELCYELYAGAQEDLQTKIEYYEDALTLCHNILKKIDEQVNSGTEEGKEGKDENYAMIYRAFTNRNISVIHKQLQTLQPENAQEHLQLQKEYCRKTYEIRKALYGYYKSGTREQSQMMDFVSQEYYLSLVEQYQFEEDPLEKRKIQRTAKMIHDKVEDRARVQNMILQTLKNQQANLLCD